jgi:alkylation response protein AidB-like acyl-CoA dehydrogenase
MAGYSGTPLAKKLGIKPGTRLALDAAPPGWAVPELPDRVVAAAAAEPADVVVAFFREAAELPERLPALARRIFPAGALWLAWPRKAGGHVSDITENGLRDHALPLGIVDNKVAAIDEDWSGLRVVWRVEHRSGPPPV